MNGNGGTELWAWFVQEEDGGSGIIATQTHLGIMPLVTSREGVATGPFEVLARNHAATSGRPVSLRIFTYVEERKKVEP